MNSTIGQRLRIARKKRGVTQPELAKKVGVTKSSVSQWETGLTKNMDSGNLLGICRSLKIRPEWLQYGKGEMDTNEISSRSNVEPGPKITGKIPVLDWSDVGKRLVVIGKTIDPNVEWRLTTIDVSGDAYALRVKGDSMANPHGSPSIPDGYIVTVDPRVEAVNGDIVVANISDEHDAILRKLVIEGNRTYLKALNPAYPVIEADEFCTVCGKVVKVEFDL